jgi:hypothetical protein
MLCYVRLLEREAELLVEGGGHHLSY